MEPTTEAQLLQSFTGTRVVILRGITGSGKSTYAAKLVERAAERGIQTFVCSIDAYTVDAAGAYTYAPYMHHKATAQCLRDYDAVLRHRYDTEHPHAALVVVDNNNLFNEDVAPYAALAKAYECELHLVAMRCDPYTALARAIHPAARDETLVRAVKLAKEVQFSPTWWPRHLEVVTDRLPTVSP